jgi:hypothetical protein
VSEAPNHLFITPNVRVDSIYIQGQKLLDRNLQRKAPKSLTVQLHDGTQSEVSTHPDCGYIADDLKSITITKVTSPPIVQVVITDTVSKFWYSAGDEESRTHHRDD